MNRRVPIEAELPFSVIRFGFNETRFQGGAVHAANESALRFGIHIIWIGRICERPETVPAKKIFPAAVGNSSRVLRVASPDAVVLQPPVNMVGIRLVHAYVIKLGNWQVVALPPGVPAIVGIPDPAIGAGDQMIGVIGIDPDIVEVAVGTLGNGAETFAAIFTHD